MANAAEHDDNYSLAGALFFLSPFIIGFAFGIFEASKSKKPEPASNDTVTEFSLGDGDGEASADDTRVVVDHRERKMEENQSAASQVLVPSTDRSLVINAPTYGKGIPLGRISQFPGALKSHRPTLLIGSPTFGKGVRIPDHSIQLNGVVPEIEFEPDDQKDAAKVIDLRGNSGGS